MKIQWYAIFISNKTICEKNYQWLCVVQKGNRVLFKNNYDIVSNFAVGEYDLSAGEKNERHFWLTPKEWTRMNWFLAKNFTQLYHHSVLQEPGKPYFAYVENTWYDGFGLSRSLAHVPYPNWAFIWYIGGGTSICMEHNHARYIMLALENGWIAYVAPALVRVLIAHKKIKKDIHIISDGRTMLIK